MHLFYSGRQFYIKRSKTVKLWQPHIDNCFLSYKSARRLTQGSSEVPRDDWINPKCEAKKDVSPLDKECDISSAKTNGMDYYERITPMFVQFDVAYDSVVNETWMAWEKPLKAVANVKDPSKEFQSEYFQPSRYADESQYPRANLDKVIDERYTWLVTRRSIEAKIAAKIKSVIPQTEVFDRDDIVFVNIERAAAGMVAYINTGVPQNDRALQVAVAAGGFTVDIFDGHNNSVMLRAVKVLSPEAMRCPPNTASPSGFGSKTTCKQCGVDFYANTAQTSCLKCPFGTMTQPGRTSAEALTKKKCVASQSQTEARKGAFREGFEFYGHFAAPLGKEGKGRFGQGMIKMKIVEATFVERTSSIKIGAFIEAHHGEECNRERPSDNICMCGSPGSKSTYRCYCSGGSVQTTVCQGSDCSCRDPGVTSYYLQGTATGDTITLDRCGNTGNLFQKEKPCKFKTNPAQQLYSGITDRNDWLFVPRSFTGNVRYENGNTVLSGRFAKPSAEPGNTAGFQTVPSLSIDVTNNWGKCVGDCDEAGYVKMTERCYSSMEAGTFTKSDTFTGSYSCYRPGTAMAVTGLNKKPALNVRKLGIKIIGVEVLANMSKVYVSAEVTVGFGTGKALGEGRFVAKGYYSTLSKKVTLTPTKDAWLTSHPDNVFAGQLTGKLTQEGEFFEGVFEENPKCKCTGTSDSSNEGDSCQAWSRDDKRPWCYVGPECSERFEFYDQAADVMRQRSFCDDATGYLQESTGFYETCTSYKVARICQTPVAACDPGWTLIPEANRCYRYFGDTLTHVDAASTCSNSSAHLVSVHGFQEMEKIVDLVKSESQKSLKLVPKFVWMGLIVKEKYDKKRDRFLFSDESPVAWDNHVKDTPVGPYGFFLTDKKQGSGSFRRWHTDPSSLPASSFDANTTGTRQADDAKLAYVCKKPPKGQLAPCVCSGVTDENNWGGHCKKWGGIYPWSSTWCYVSYNCGRGTFDALSRRTRASCVARDAPPPPTPPPMVSTNFRDDVSCRAKEYQSSSTTCEACTTVCPTGNVSSRIYGDVCGSQTVDPPSSWEQMNATEQNRFRSDNKGFGRSSLGKTPALWTVDVIKTYKDHDFTCCSEFNVKRSLCAAQGMMVSARNTCRDGRDFACTTCPEGSFFPRTSLCTNPAQFDKRICKCTPCTSTCGACERTSDYCTKCDVANGLYLKSRGEGRSSCVPTCYDAGSEDARAYYLDATSNISAASCAKCTTCDNESLIQQVPCTENADAICVKRTTTTTSLTKSSTSTSSQTESTATSESSTSTSSQTESTTTIPTTTTTLAPVKLTFKLLDYDTIDLDRLKAQIRTVLATYAVATWETVLITLEKGSIIATLYVSNAGDAATLSDQLVLAQIIKAVQDVFTTTTATSSTTSTSSATTSSTSKSTTSSTQASCREGLYVDVTSNTCRGCDTGTFTDGRNRLKCSAWSECEAGQLEVAGSATTSSNRRCTSPNECSADQWESGKEPNGQRTCTAVKDCYAGEYVLKPSTRTSDRVCSGCDGRDYFSTEKNVATCSDVTFCSSNEYVTSSSSPSQDLQCSPCPTGLIMEDMKHRQYRCTKTTTTTVTETTTTTMAASSTSTSTTTTSSTTESTGIPASTQPLVTNGANTDATDSTDSTTKGTGAKSSDKDKGSGEDGDDTMMYIYIVVVVAAVLIVAVVIGVVRKVTSSPRHMVNGAVRTAAARNHSCSMC